MARIGAPTISREVAEHTLEVIHECLEEGLPFVGKGGAAAEKSARQESARRLGITHQTLGHRLRSMEMHFGLKPDLSRYVATRAAFEIDDLPHDGEPDAEELIELLKDRYDKRKAHHDASKLRQVKVNIPGPIAVAFFGDPHVDDPGCAWGDLERDVRLCRETEGVLAVDVGDNSNNWVGRLMALYANQDVTAKQSLKLVEWLMLALPWLLDVDGNHDCHDFETEALTKRGWLFADDIKDDDEVLSLNIETGLCEWVPILRKIERENIEDMVSIETSVVSLNVTPKHRILHKNRNTKNQELMGFQYCHANSLPCRFSLPVSAVFGLPEYPISDTWIALAGWFLTDGSVHWAGKSPKVSFYQSKKSDELEAALEGCGLSPRVSVRQRNHTHICGRQLTKPPLPSKEWVLSAEQSRQALSVLESKGVIQSWVWSLSERQFEIFLRAVIAGDGSWASNGHNFAAVVHGTKGFLDSLQAVCVAHGWNAHLSVARGKDWRLNVSRRREYQANRSAVVRRSPPADKVWCLTVKHGNFMIRRNGKAHFSGNCWHTDTSDPREIMHRLHNRLGVKATSGARLQLNMPAGNTTTMHVRHDFPGGSQFNPAHALVRETLFGFRDHLMACGHRHSAGYIPVWHNDPRRLCHGFRVGTYKDMDHYARDKGFQENNWARSMAAVIDPDFANDPVRYIKPFFSLEDATEYLTWRRSKWGFGKTAD